MPSRVETVCNCGRAYVHCPVCGRRNPYLKKYESANLSVLSRKEVKAYRCSCGVEFTSDDACTLQPKKKAEPVTQENMILGSEQHAILLADWVTEMQRKNKGWDAIRVYIEAQKAGWHLEAFGDLLDEDVKKALVERGLLGAGAPSGEQSGDVTCVAESEATVLPEADTQAPTESPVSLDEIIKNMQENSK